MILETIYRCYGGNTMDTIESREIRDLWVKTPNGETLWVSDFTLSTNNHIVLLTKKM